MNLKSVLSLLAAGSVMMVVAPAFGQSSVGGERTWTLSAGIKGGVNMQGAQEVSDLSVAEMQSFGLNPARPQSEDPGIYGQFGAGPAIGGTFEARYNGVVGLELGLFYAQDSATGWEDKLVNGQDQGRVLHDLSVEALHIPVLIKGVVNNETVKPFVGAGIEVVLQQSSSLEYRAENDVTQYPQSFVDGAGGQPGFADRVESETSNYVVLQLNFGVEFDLGELRIPFEIRAGFNPGYGGDRFEDRMATEGGGGVTNFIYNSQYMGHIGVYTGLAYDFDLAL